LINSLEYHLSKRNEKKIDKLKYKVVVFILPVKSVAGVQNNEIRFPFDGKVEDVFASCKTVGETDTIISVEKIPLSSLEDISASWEQIVNNVVITTGKRSNNGNLINIVNNDINKMIIYE